MKNAVGARLVVLFAAVMLVAVPVRAGAESKIAALYVFGDSLADTGNDWIVTKALGLTPAVPPSVSPHKTYFKGRFSNGPIVFEYLCVRLGVCAEANVTPFLANPRIPQKGAVSLAFGGTGSDWLTVTPGGFQAPGLKGQVELFRVALKGRPAPADALYTIFTGANDYPLEPGRETLAPSTVVNNIVDAVRTLYKLGARRVMVVNLPDPQIFPSFTMDLIPDSEKLQLIALTNAHNALLAGALGQLGTDRKKLKLIAIDINDAIQTVIVPEFIPAPPTTFFFPSPDPLVPVFVCLFTNPAVCPDVPTFDGNRFLFWDVVHPTTEAQARFADYLYDKVVNQP
jgi:phospholipase/lecithinase/hemolysin